MAQNSPADTSELIPFGANSDLRWNCPPLSSELLPLGANFYLPWDWRFPEILIEDSSLIFPFGIYYASNLVGNYIYPRWGFTMLLLYWGTTCPKWHNDPWNIHPSLSFIRIIWKQSQAPGSSDFLWFGYVNIIAWWTDHKIYILLNIDNFAPSDGSWS